MSRVKSLVSDQPTGCTRCGGALPGEAALADVCICQYFEWGAAHPIRLEDPRTSDAWRYIGHLLAMRSGERCEVCGERFVPGVHEPSIHHRQPRGMGGTSDPGVHDLPRLVLAGAGFSRRLAGVIGCHGLVESQREWARSRHLLVPQGLDAATVPLVLASGRIVYLGASDPWYINPPAGEPRYDLTAVA